MQTFLDALPLAKEKIMVAWRRTKLNAEGPAGLVAGKAPGNSPLNAGTTTALAGHVIDATDLSPQRLSVEC
jgi:hypothetical protein